jgi:O-antigen/teichoic acid export membrane protein
LWVGFFFSNVEAGYFKFSLAVMNIIVLPLQPFLGTTFPEISKAVAQKSWLLLRRLLRRTSLIAAAWTGACAMGALLLGPVLLGWFKNGAYLPSLPVILLLLLGYGLANIFYWNRALLLAFGKPNTPLFITAGVGLLKTILLLWLVPGGGVLVQAGLLTAYFTITGLWIAASGLLHIRRSRQAGEPAI